jgi:hypothetical protein
MTPMGRPEVGKQISVRLGGELLAQADAYAEAQRIKPADAIRQLAQRGLRRNGRQEMTADLAMAQTQLNLIR